MLQRQNLPPQPSPTASHHHGIMYGNNMAGNPCGALSGPSYGCSSTTWTPPTTHPTPCQTYGQPIPHYPPHPGPRPPSFGGFLPPPPGGNPFPPPPPGPFTRPPPFPSPSTASQSKPPPALRPVHSVPTPTEFNPGDDHYDTTRVAGYDLPKVITHTAFTRQMGIEGQDIARVPLLHFMHEQWNSWWLRHLAHGGEVRIVVAKSMPESVFAAGLLSQIRQRHLDLDALALHVATQEGASTSTTKPAAMKLLTSKIFDFLISLRPTTTADPASAATILQLQQQLADAHNQLAQQASSPPLPPTPTSSNKRPADPSQASLLDFGMKRPRLTTPDTSPQDGSPALPLPTRIADDSQPPPGSPHPRRQPSSPLHPRRHPDPSPPPLPTHLEGAPRLAPTTSPRLPMAHQQLPTRHFRHQSPAMDHLPENQQRWSNDCAKWATTLDSDTRAQLERAAVLWGIPVRTLSKLGSSALGRILAAASHFYQ